MTMSGLIWKALVAILDYNERRFGRGSSHELCRDLRGRYAEVVG